ncbi:MAG: hypothetical protein MJ108_08240 [Saccharofermentans sp.]|nr:hypothetical protein [Saccharofermentans sp.]
MTRRRTNEEFVNDLAVMHPSIVVLGEYVNNLTKIPFKCGVCNYTWETTPKSIYKGCGCPKCSAVKNSQKRRKNTEQFIKDLLLVNPSITVNSHYVDSKSKINVTSKLCGHSWDATPNALLRGSDCPICKGNLLVIPGVNDIATSCPDLIKEWNYDRNEVLPSELRPGSTKKVWWIGKCGHEWYTSPNSRVKGHGCPICSGNVLKTREKFISEMSEYNPYIEIIGDYVNAITNITAQCKICGYQWDIKPYRLLTGAQCTQCIKPHTSFMEQFIYISFVTVLGENKVLSRDLSAIGKELDIFIPDYSFAIEPGTWRYHKSKVNSSDLEKRELCKSKSIRLITIYDTFPKNQRAPYDKDCFVYEGFLNEFGYKRLIDLVVKLFEMIGIINLELDWGKIANMAYQACHLNANSSFCQELKKINSDIEVLEDYKGSNTPILVNSKSCSHTPWMERPYLLLRGKGCPECSKEKAKSRRKYTASDFLEKISIIHPNISLVSEFDKVTDRIDVFCNDCSLKWNVKASSLLSGKGCPHCSAIAGGKNREGKTATKSQKQFESELLEKNPSIKILGEYVNSKTKIEAECLACSYKWSVVPASLLNGHGCPICSRKNRKTHNG